MVKLLKHELIALFRVLGFVAIATVLFAISARVFLQINSNNALSDNANTVTTLLFMLSIVGYMAAMFALIFVAWWLSIKRFYRTLFTREGYLTFSLPVSPMQIIWAKLLSALIAMFFASIVSALSLSLFFIGWDANFMEALGEVFGEIYQFFYDFYMSEPLILVGNILLTIVNIPLSLLVIYALISVGQLFTNHRLGITIGIGFALYLAYSFISLLVFTPIQYYLEEVGYPHVWNWIMIAIDLAIDVGCFFLVRYILKNKVNLIA